MIDVDARTSPCPALTLGPGGPAISPIGVGAWAWGDRLFWQYGRQQSAADVQAAFEATLAAGINLIDTAEFYGFGRSERLLQPLLRARQACAAAADPRPVVTTKFFPYPWRVRRADLLRALRGSLARLGLDAVDLYLVHWPWPPVPVETWAAGLAEAVHAGLARSVGVSNYNLAQMDRARAVLARHGIPLAANQVQFSLLSRAPEHSGLLAACRERGITLIAHSPLAEGLLTGKYTARRRPSGFMRRRFGRGLLERIQPLIALLADVGRAHGDKTPAQVAVNWIVAKGAVPIPGARNARQATQNAGALGWRLAADQVAALDDMSDRVRRP